MCITAHGLRVMWFRNDRGPGRWGIPIAQNGHRSLDQQIRDTAQEPQGSDRGQAVTEVFAVCSCF